MITNIQVLRGLAALAVVLLHSQYKFFGVVTSQFQGVSIFFVISGFIVAYITKGGMTEFMRRRIVRIVPMYWVVTIFALFWLSLGQFDWLWWVVHDPMQAYLQVKNVFFHDGYAKARSYVMNSLLFLPVRDPSSGDYGSFLYTGWTLNIECFFYVLFAIFGLVGRRAALVGVTATFAVLAWLNWATSNDGALVRFYGQGVSLYIPAGFFVYAFWERYGEAIASVSARWIAAFAGVVGFFVLLLNAWICVEPSIKSNIPVMVFYHLLPPLVVLAALLCHSAGMRARWKPLMALGDWSYVLYLSHVLVLTTMARYATRFPVLDSKASVGNLMLAIVLCCVVAWLLHVGVERPLLNRAQRWFGRKALTQATLPVRQ